MSFGVLFIGRPDAIKRKLAEFSEKNVSGQSKEEFDAIKPALETLLDQQVGNGVISLAASGHASFTEGQKTYGNCSVEVKVLGGELAL